MPAEKRSITWDLVFRWGTGLGLLAMLSRISGLAREATIANYMGVGSALDVYYLASAVPLFFAWMGDIAAYQTVLPLFTRAKRFSSDDSAWRQASGLLWICTFGLALIGFLALLFSSKIWGLVSGGQTGESSKIGIALFQISLPILIIQMVGGWQFGILQSQKRFFLPAAIPLVYNFGFVVVLALGASRYGIFAMGLAIILAESLRLLLQAPALRSIGMRFHTLFRPDFRSAKKSLVHLLPIALAAGLQQSLFISDRLMATNLPEGSISALGYGARLLILPLSLLVAAIATPLFSLFADSAVEKDWVKLREWVLGGLRVTIGLGVPISLAMVFLREPLLIVLFQRGAFDAQAVRLAGDALLGYAPALVFFASLQILGQCFYALDRSFSPLLSSLLAAALNVGLNYALRPALGHEGLAIATSISFAVCACLQATALQKHLGALWPELRKMIRSTLIPAAVMSVNMFYVTQALASLFPAGGFRPALLNLLIAGVTGCLIYVMLWRFSRR